MKRSQIKQQTAKRKRKQHTKNGMGHTASGQHIERTQGRIRLVDTNIHQGGNIENLHGIQHTIITAY